MASIELRPTIPRPGEDRPDLTEGSPSFEKALREGADLLKAWKQLWDAQSRVCELSGARMAELVLPPVNDILWLIPNINDPPKAVIHTFDPNSTGHIIQTSDQVRVYPGRIVPDKAGNPHLEFKTFDFPEGDYALVYVPLAPTMNRRGLAGFPAS